MKRKTFLKTCGLSLVTTAALLSGATATWVGEGGDTNWTTTENWDTGVVPGAGDTAVFTGVPEAGSEATINAAVTLSQLKLYNKGIYIFTNGGAQTFTFNTVGKKARSISGGAAFSFSNNVSMSVTDSTTASIQAPVGYKSNIVGLTGAGGTPAGSASFSAVGKNPFGSNYAVTQLKKITGYNGSITNNSRSRLVLTGVTAMPSTAATFGILNRKNGTILITDDFGGTIGGSITNQKGGTITLNNTSLPAPATIAINGGVSNSGTMNLVGNQAVTTTFANSDFVNRGTLNISNGAATYNFNVDVTNTGTINIEKVTLASGLAFGVNVVNNGNININEAATDGSIQFGGTVTNNRNFTINADGGATFQGAVTNNRNFSILGSDLSASASADFSAGTFVNNKNFTIAECAGVSMGALTNNGVIRVYGSTGVTDTTVAMAAAITNNGTIYVYGVDAENPVGTGSIAGAGIIDMATFNYVGNNKSRLYVSGFGQFYGTGSTTLNDSSQINLFGEANAGQSLGVIVLNNSSRMNVYGKAIATVVGNLTVNDSAAFSLYESAKFVGDNGQARVYQLNGTGSINIYDSTLMQINDLNILKVTGAGRLNAYGNAEIVFAGAGTVPATNVASLTLNNGSVNFYGNSIIKFNQFSKILKEGAGAQAGAINVYGNAEVVVSGANVTFDSEAPFNIYQNGLLTLNDATVLGDQVFTVGNANRKLKGGTIETLGAVTVGGVNLINGGTLSLAPSQVFTVSQTSQSATTFTMGAGSTLNYEIAEATAAANNGIVYSGTTTNSAKLGGTLHLKISGAAVAGEAYNIILSAGNAIDSTTTFSNVTYENNGTTLEPAGPPAVTAAAAGITLQAIPAMAKVLSRAMASDKFSGNQKAVGRHIVKSAAQFKNTADGRNVASKLRLQKRSEIATNLGKLTPSMKAKTAHRGLASARAMAKDVNQSLTVQRNFQKVFKKEHEQKGLSLNTAWAMNGAHNDFFINSMDLGKSQLGAIASKASGANFGWTHLYNGALVVENGFGCSQSELTSKDELGTMNTNAVFFSPSVAMLSDNGYVSFMVLAGASQTEQTREIAFNNLERTATSMFNSIEAMAQLDAGYTLNLGNIASIEVSGSLGAQALHSGSYQEKGAGALNLTVLGQNAYSVQPSAKLVASKEMFVNGKAITASLYADASSELYLNDGVTQAYFSLADKKDAFETRSSVENSSKASVGADMSFKASKNFECSAHVESDALKGFKDNSAEVKFNWLF